MTAYIITVSIMYALSSLIDMYNFGNQQKGSLLLSSFIALALAVWGFCLVV